MIDLKGPACPGAGETSLPRIPPCIANAAMNRQRRSPKQEIIGNSGLSPDVVSLLLKA